MSRGPSAELAHDLRKFHFAPPSREPDKATTWRSALLREGGLPRAGEADDLMPEEPGRPPCSFLAEVARVRRQPVLAAFREEAVILAAQCEALLEADRQRRPESRQADSVADAMGSLGSRLIDASMLTRALDGRRQGGTALPEARRESLRAARETLGEFAEIERPELMVVHEDHEELGDLGQPDGHGEWRVSAHDDPCAAAADLFDAEARWLVRLLAAARRIRLEAEGSYRSELHEPWLGELDWRSLTGEELLLMPPVAAVVRADQVARGGLASLSRLLLSGRPVQAVVLARPFANPGHDGDALAGFRFEPAYLGLSHREAFVQQTSTARADHLAEGFRRSLGTGRAALHVVLSGSAPGAPEIAGRAHPLFRYEPDAGWSWADRLDFSGNPQPAADWPVYELDAAGGAGDAPRSLAFTFADLALSEPGYARHFSPVPDGVPDDVLVDMAAYCALSPEEAARRVPCVWAADAGRPRLLRLAVSRPLARACLDRLDFWRTLQELSGIRSEHARRAALAAREQAEATAEREISEIEARHRAELERVREDAVRDVVDRLTASLLEVDVATLTAPAPAPSLARFQGRGVDEVSAALLELVDPATLDAAAGTGDGDGQVEHMAAELRRLLTDAG